MRKLFKRWFSKPDYVMTYHTLYGRGENCDVDLVWADRNFYQRYGRMPYRYRGRK